MEKKLLLSLPYFRQNEKKTFQINILKNGPIAGPEMESCPRQYMFCPDVGIFLFEGRLRHFLTHHEIIRTIQKSLVIILQTISLFIWSFSDSIQTIYCQSKTQPQYFLVSGWYGIFLLEGRLRHFFIHHEIVRTIQMQNFKNNAFAISSEPFFNILLKVRLLVVLLLL